MALSEKLISEAENLWLEAADKEFLVNMAEGTLDEVLFKNYMIQDYLYLKDYIQILNKMYEMAEDDELKDFLAGIIKDTEYETYSIHVPSLKSLGISDEDIESCRMGQVIKDYIAYMEKRLEENGILAGLTALLQCSWNYAYIARLVSDRYSDKMPESRYRSWFDAYTSEAYTRSNQLWIEMLDKRTEDISNEEADRLCFIFKNCAVYENKLWDFLMG